jgi:hypothetical protein
VEEVEEVAEGAAAAAAEVADEEDLTAEGEAVAEVVVAVEVSALFVPLLICTTHKLLLTRRMQEGAMRPSKEGIETALGTTALVEIILVEVRT